MKHSIIATACGLLVCLAALASNRLEQTCRLTLKLTDADSGHNVSGMIRILDHNGSPVATPELLSRGLGLKGQSAIERWSVVATDVTLNVPRDRLVIEAFSGLETELNRQEIDLAGRSEARLSVPLKRFYNAAQHALASGNTHLHLMKLSREEADRYLVEVPRADDLDVLFVSYLERAEADRDYISNRYTRRDLEQFTKASGVVFGNGEEHRHNFTAQGEGYGHVMLLDIPQLVQPVSIGPGITKNGTDGLPLQRGIDQARRDRATVVWCHNNWGTERLVNQITGRLNAQNIFDGGPHGSFKDSYYRSLNAGLNVPFSTGTDWFMYDFSRVYARVDGPLTVTAWLDALSSGRSYITNGPFLEFKVAGRQPGDTVSLDQPGSMQIVARGIGRIDFRRIELVQNGKVVQSQPSRREDGHFVADLRHDLPLAASCWLALRIPPPPVKDDPELTEPAPLNEYGQPLFAHTSAIHVRINDKPYVDRNVAEGLLAELRTNIRTIERQGQFADDSERARVLDVYHDAIAAFEKRLAAVSERP